MGILSIHFDLSSGFISDLVVQNVDPSVVLQQKPYSSGNEVTCCNRPYHIVPHRIVKLPQILQIPPIRQLPYDYDANRVALLLQLLAVFGCNSYTQSQWNLNSLLSVLCYCVIRLSLSHCRPHGDFEF